MLEPTEVFGKTIKPSAYKDFFSRAGAAGLNLPREFVRDVLPHLFQEMPGETVGTMLNSMSRALVGGQTTKKAIDSFDGLGLVDWDHVKVDKKGQYTTDAGWLKGTNTPNWNPFTWSQDFYEPALHGKFSDNLKQHPLSEEQMEHHFTADFSNRNVSKAVRILAEQKAIIDKDAIQIEAAPGLGGVDKLAREDPHLASAAMGSQFGNFGQIAGGPFMGPMTAGKNTLADLMAHVNHAMEPIPEVTAGILAATTTGAAYLGAKTLQMVPNKLAGAVGGAAESVIGGAARFANPVGQAITTVELARLAEHEMERVTSHDAMKYAFDQIPGWREHGELARRGADDFRRDPEAARGRALADLDRPNRGGTPIEVPDFLRHAPGEPIHVVVDGDKSGKGPGIDAPHATWQAPFGSAAHPAGLAIPMPGPATGGTATPSLAQPVVNNTTNNNTTNAPVTVHAPVSVVVNVSSPSSAPGAVGSAVGAAAAGALTSAVKQSPGVMHDGYGPH